MLFEAGESKRIEIMKMLVNLIIQKLICEVIDMIQFYKQALR